MAADKVTLRDIYEAVNRIEDKFDSRFKTLEDRTGILEQFNSNLRGKFFVLYFIINFVTVVVIEFIRKQFNIQS